MRIFLYCTSDKKKNRENVDIDSPETEAGYRRFNYGSPIRDCEAELKSSFPYLVSHATLKGDATAMRDLSYSKSQGGNDKVLLQMINDALGPGGYRSLSTGGNLLYLKPTLHFKVVLRLYHFPLI